MAPLPLVTDTHPLSASVCHLQSCGPAPSTRTTPSIPPGVNDKGSTVISGGLSPLYNLVQALIVAPGRLLRIRPADTTILLAWSARTASRLSTGRDCSPVARIVLPHSLFALVTPPVSFVRSCYADIRFRHPHPNHPATPMAPRATLPLQPTSTRGWESDVLDDDRDSKTTTTRHVRFET